MRPNGLAEGATPRVRWATWRLVPAARRRVGAKVNYQTLEAKTDALAYDNRRSMDAPGVCLVEITMWIKGERRTTKAKRDSKKDCAGAGLGAGRWNCRKLSAAFYFREMPAAGCAWTRRGGSWPGSQYEATRAVPGSMPNSAKRETESRRMLRIQLIPRRIVLVSLSLLSSCWPGLIARLLPGPEGS